MPPRCKAGRQASSDPIFLVNASPYLFGNWAYTSYLACDITSSADAGILCRPLHPVPSAPGPLFSSTALRRLSEGLSTNSYGHREERGARTIVAGQNSSGVALPKRQPKRADFCPISPATILRSVAISTPLPALTTDELVEDSSPPVSSS